MFSPFPLLDEKKDERGRGRRRSRRKKKLTNQGLGILGSSIVVASVVLLVLEETDVADTAKITDFLLSWI